MQCLIESIYRRESRLTVAMAMAMGLPRVGLGVVVLCGLAMQAHGNAHSHSLRYFPWREAEGQQQGEDACVEGQEGDFCEHCPCHSGVQRAAQHSTAFPPFPCSPAALPLESPSSARSSCSSDSQRPWPCGG
jgi:hypothetical protein